MPDTYVDYTVYLVLAPFICLIIASLLVVILHRRQYKGAMSLFWFVLCAEGYLVSNYLELVLGIERGSLLSAKIENVFVSLIPVSWLWFVFDFVERYEWRRFVRFWPFFVPPIFTTGLVFTNDYHHLFWSEIHFVPIGGYRALQVAHGGLYYVAMFLTYAMLLAGIFVIGRELVRGRRVYRRQLFWISGGIVVALVFNMVYIFQLIPGVRKDLTSIGFALGAVTFFIGIYRHRFLELNTAPRSRLFDALRDGVIVIDGRKKITDMNRAAMAILGLAESDLGALIYRCGLLAPLFDRLDDEGNIDVDISTGAGDDARHYEAHLDLLHKRDAGRNGAVLVLHDITERVRLFEEIRTLRGIVPICAKCKKIRDDEGYWQSVEAYVSEHSYAEFSHGLCPECLRALYPDLMEGLPEAGR